MVSAVNPTRPPAATDPTWTHVQQRLAQRTREVIARGDHDELDSLSRARAAVAQLIAHPTHGAR